MKVYDPKGKEFDKEAVDAMECIRQLGWSSNPPKGKKISKKEKPKQEDPLSVSDIRGRLDQRNVPYKSNDNKERLLELLADSKPNRG